jgi:hypothetical protein
MDGFFRILKKAVSELICTQLYFEKKSQAFFNILIEPLLVQKQTILQQKGLILSFLELEKFEGVVLLGGFHTHLLQKDI